MKAFFAILFSLLLVFEQTALTLGANNPVPAPAKNCARCGCDMPNCCSAKTAPAEPSAPAAPARGATQVSPGDLLVVTAALIQDEPKSPVSFVPSSSQIPVPAVPLFQRNCALLI